MGWPRKLRLARLLDRSSLLSTNHKNDDEDDLASRRALVELRIGYVPRFALPSAASKPLSGTGRFARSSVGSLAYAKPVAQ